MAFAISFSFLFTFPAREESRGGETTKEQNSRPSANIFSQLLVDRMSFLANCDFERFSKKEAKRGKLVKQ
jgi:hypothetical protein